MRNVRDRILVELKMLDAGVVPNTNHLQNVEDQLKMMSPEDAQRAKRKWRKLKRKALKNHRANYSGNIPRQTEKYAVIMMLARDRNT